MAAANSLACYTGFPVWGSKMDTVEAVVRGVAAFMERLVDGRVGI